MNTRRTGHTPRAGIVKGSNDKDCPVSDCQKATHTGPSAAARINKSLGISRDVRAQ